VSLQTDLLLLLPELAVAVGAMILLLTGAIGGEKLVPVVTWGAVCVLLLAGIGIVMGPQGTAFHGAFVADEFSRFANVLILAGGALCILLADEYFVTEKVSRFELPVLLMLATLGMMLMVSATSFLALYMGLELQSLALYVLAAFNRDNVRSSEAGLKYFVLSALAASFS
jgi:NADH-quinone oxidoreductase subunit N